MTRRGRCTTSSPGSTVAGDRPPTLGGRTAWDRLGPGAGGADCPRYCPLGKTKSAAAS
jgi:hypothetical protein